MKRILFTVIISFIFTSIFYSQINEFGVSIGNNFSSHTNFNPQIPEDGQFQWNNLNGLNLGIYTSYNLSKKWSLRGSLNFQQKGYTEIAQTASIIANGLNEETNDFILENRLSYLSFGLFGDFKLNSENKNQIFSIFLGLENNFQLNRTLESEMIPEIATFHPVNQYQDNWNTYHLNTVGGLRVSVKEIAGISGFFSRSLSPVLKTDSLIVKDWIWGIALDLNLLKILSDK